MAYQIPLTIKETLRGIADERFVLPAIQREFVWATEPERMARLFDSILRGYPIGTFLFWKVSPETAKEFHFYEFMREWHERKKQHNERLHLPEPRELTAILDGQQRLTTLNIGLHGSIAHKLPRKKVDSIDAYPAKRLHVDLRHKPTDDDDLQYRFEFITDEHAAKQGESHWYRAGAILDVEEPGEPIYDYVVEHDLTGTPAFKVLAALWKAVHEDGVISYFEEKEQSLSKVLDIFVRVNSGGVVLTKSDLLLSIATAQFKERDARDTVHGLVDDLNATTPGFKFSKDLVLKAGLVCNDIGDLGFKVENFTVDNMRKLDENWDSVALALRVGVKLLASFGFSEKTLPANSVLIPIADYLHHRRLDEKYVSSAKPADIADRERLRHWTLRTILKPGIWGSGLDGLLKAIHEQIRVSEGDFPLEAVNSAMAKRGKSLSFDVELLDALVDTPYKHKRTFALLSLLFDWVDTRNAFHVDHVFPRSLATAAKLKAQGLPADIAAEISDRIERLPNLQLLPGPENIAKSATMPADWYRTTHHDPTARANELARHDLTGLPTDLIDFPQFFDARRRTLLARLRSLLGKEGSTDGTPPDDQPHVEASTLTGGRRHFSASLHDLVLEGRIGVGQRVIGTYKQSKVQAMVTEDGRLEADGETFDSVSQAARILTGQAAVNGWAFWHTEQGRPLSELRDG